MSGYIYSVVMALAFFGVVALGAYSNYRFIKRLAERETSR